MACTVEGSYAPHSAAMLHSMLTQCGDLTVQVHYLHGPGAPSEADRLVEGMVERHGATISFISVPDDRVAGLPAQGFTRKATWYRILLAELLPDIDRVLFLDVDLIVLSSLRALWETDLDDHYVAAVTNLLQHDHMHRPAELGIDRPQDYFNAGVMLMNLDLIRRDGCSEALLSYGVEHAGELMFRDQDALNVVLGARRLALHPRWNCMTSILGFPYAGYAFGARALEEARRDPAIRHFEGPDANKPWHVLCDSPLRESYLEHRRYTPWPEVRLEGATLRSRAHSLRRRLSP